VVELVQPFATLVSSPDTEGPSAEEVGFAFTPMGGDSRQVVEQVESDDGAPVPVSVSVPVETTLRSVPGRQTRTGTAPTTRRTQSQRRQSRPRRRSSQAARGIEQETPAGRRRVERSESSTRPGSLQVTDPSRAPRGQDRTDRGSDRTHPRILLLHTQRHQHSARSALASSDHPACRAAREQRITPVMGLRK
jgi:hypothetical protein